MSSSCCGACAGQDQDVDQKNEEAPKQEQPTVQEYKPESTEEK